MGCADEKNARMFLKVAEYLDRLAASLERSLTAKSKATA
jgi:hypothetical protein